MTMLDMELSDPQLRFIIEAENGCIVSPRSRDKDGN
jgi:hypothetical protein